MQVAAFAEAGDQKLPNTVATVQDRCPESNCRRRFSGKVETDQAYGYSLFNLEAMAAIVNSLSPNDNLSHSKRRMVAASVGNQYMAPFIRDKKSGHEADVMYDTNGP